jgi:hypothetical protein
MSKVHNYQEEYQVNNQYTYETTEMQFLTLSLYKETPLDAQFAVTPVAIDEKYNSHNNEELRGQYNNLQAGEKLLVPVLFDASATGVGHWVGAVVEKGTNNVTSITWLNSLEGSEITSERKDAFTKAVGIINPAVNYIGEATIKQPDVTSCGACTIENLLNHANNVTQDTSSMEDIRKKHMAILGEEFAQLQSLKPTDVGIEEVQTSFISQCFDKLEILKKEVQEYYQHVTLFKKEIESNKENVDNFLQEASKINPSEHEKLLTDSALNIEDKNKPLLFSMAKQKFNTSDREAALQIAKQSYNETKYDNDIIKEQQQLLDFYKSKQQENQKSKNGITPDNSPRNSALNTGKAKGI